LIADISEARAHGRPRDGIPRETLLWSATIFNRRIIANALAER
jgi:hypothetical protein